MSRLQWFAILALMVAAPCLASLPDDDGLPPRVPPPGGGGGGGGGGDPEFTARGTFTNTDGLLEMSTGPYDAGSVYMLWVLENTDGAAFNDAPIVTGSVSGGWSSVTGQNVGPATCGYLTLYSKWFPDAVGAETITIECQNGANELTASLESWTGLVTDANPLDVFKVEFGTSDAPTATTLTTTQAETIVTAAAAWAGTTPAEGTWGNDLIDGGQGIAGTETAAACLTVGNRLTSGHKIVVIQGTQTASKALASSVAWAMIVAAFKVAP